MSIDQALLNYQNMVDTFGPVYDPDPVVRMTENRSSEVSSSAGSGVPLDQQSCSSDSGCDNKHEYIPGGWTEQMGTSVSIDHEYKENRPDGVNLQDIIITGQRAKLRTTKHRGSFNHMNDDTRSSRSATTGDGSSIRESSTFTTSSSSDSYSPSSSFSSISTPSVCALPAPPAGSSNTTSESTISFREILAVLALVVSIFASMDRVPWGRLAGLLLLLGLCHVGLNSCACVFANTSKLQTGGLGVDMEKKRT